MKLLRCIFIYLLAHLSKRKCWRVEYNNEPRFTCLLSKSEAKGLAKCWESKAWIDYDDLT